MEDLILAAKAFIKTLFENEFSGHDYFHSLRVYEVARQLAEQENADRLIVSLAALLHDTDDRKISPATHENKDNARRFLEGQGVSGEMIEAIVTIIDQVSFTGIDSVTPSTIEGKCVQDADRLDALGAIGVARTFAYGGSHHRVMYDPDEAPLLGMTKEVYQQHVSSSVNHFYEKLFYLKDMMNTESARRAAEKREAFMRAYLDEFLMEWEGKDLKN